MNTTPNALLAALAALLLVAACSATDTTTQLDATAGPQHKPTPDLAEFYVDLTTTTAPPTTLQRASRTKPRVTVTTRVARPKLPVSDGTVWYRLAQCESGGNWAINTGNGYYGGLQFSLSSWRAVGGTGYPHQHPASVQIEMGRRLQRIQGWGAWPACSRKLGLR